MLMKCIGRRLLQSEGHPSYPGLHPFVFRHSDTGLSPVLFCKCGHGSWASSGEDLCKQSRVIEVAQEDLNGRKVKGITVETPLQKGVTVWGAVEQAVRCHSRPVPAQEAIDLDEQMTVEAVVNVESVLGVYLKELP